MNEDQLKAMFKRVKERAYDNDDFGEHEHKDDKSYIIARAVIYNLLGRRGVGDELEQVDYEIRKEIIEDIAQIIYYGLSTI